MSSSESRSGAFTTRDRGMVLASGIDKLLRFVPSDRATAETAPPTDTGRSIPCWSHPTRGTWTAIPTTLGRHQPRAPTRAAKAGHEAAGTGDAGQSSGPIVFEAFATGLAEGACAPLKLSPGRSQRVGRARPESPRTLPKGRIPHVKLGYEGQGWGGERTSTG